MTKKKKYDRSKLSINCATNKPEPIHMYFTPNKYRMHMLYKNTWNIHESQQQTWVTKEASINSKEPALHKLYSDYNAIQWRLDLKRIVFKNSVCLETKTHATEQPFC